MLNRTCLHKKKIMFLADPL